MFVKFLQLKMSKSAKTTCQISSTNQCVSGVSDLLLPNSHFDKDGSSITEMCEVLMHAVIAAEFL